MCSCCGPSLENDCIRSSGNTRNFSSTGGNTGLLQDHYCNSVTAYQLSMFMFQSCVIPGCLVHFDPASVTCHSLNIHTLYTYTRSISLKSPSSLQFLMYVFHTVKTHSSNILANLHLSCVPFSTNLSCSTRVSSDWNRSKDVCFQNYNTSSAWAVYCMPPSNYT